MLIRYVYLGTGVLMLDVFVFHVYRSGNGPIICVYLFFGEIGKIGGKIGRNFNEYNRVTKHF